MTEEGRKLNALPDSAHISGLSEFTENIRDFMECLPYPMSVHDTDFNVIAANKLFLELAETDTFGKCYEIVHCTKVPPAECPALKAIKSGVPQSAELYEPRLDKHLLVQASPVLHDGSVIGVTHTITDITKVKLSELEFKEITEVLGNSLAVLKKREQELLKGREAFLNILADLNESYRDLEELFEGFVRTMVNTLDAKSQWTRGHSERVSLYAVEIARAMGLDEDEIKRARLAGLLHDIGKIGTYDYLLDKPEKLTDEEFAVIRTHPAQGAKILSGIKQFAGILPFIKHHHERVDGRGYPDKLTAEDIPLGARILCVADTFDAILADRPYRPSPGLEYAVSELNRCSGSQFDPAVVEAFLGVLSKNGAL